jgi:hypothetical protein
MLAFPQNPSKTLMVSEAFVIKLRIDPAHNANFDDTGKMHGHVERSAHRR